MTIKSWVLTLFLTGLIWMPCGAQNLAQDKSSFFIKAQYNTNKFEASQILEDTRLKLQSMLNRLGGDPHVNLIIGDMVGYWKKAKQAFENSNYDETVRICKIIQGHVF